MKLPYVYILELADIRQRCVYLNDLSIVNTVLLLDIGSVLTGL